MSAGSRPPLSRPYPLHKATPDGTVATVEATEAECTAVAAALGLPAIRSLVGRFTVSGTAERIRVAGRVAADIDQVCVVTLDAFPTDVDEEVDVTFAAPIAGDLPGDEVEADLDRPDELAGDTVDLGALAVEFLALGLDPYPRKPGASFEAPPQEDGPAGPFAGLARLKGDPEAG